MLNDISPGRFRKIYIACGYTDLRYGVDGLARVIQEEFELDPFQTDILFLFCGRRSDRIKGLVWEGDGFLMLYKRLDGGRYQWPRNEQEVRTMSPQEFRRLMDGLSVYPQIHKVYPKQDF